MTSFDGANREVLPAHMPGLNGLRALAVIAVVWHHSHPGIPYLPMSRNGFLGVDAFFVLSGFLITTLLLREQKEFGSISLRNFYIRRSLRIFPLYFAVLAALAIYFAFMPGASQRDAFLGALPYHVSYLSNWVEVDTMMAISWSLSTEEQFYLVWPPLLVLLGGRLSMLLLMLFLVVNQAVNFGYLDTTLEAMGISYHSLSILQATFTPIIFGVILAFVLASVKMRSLLARMLGDRVVWVVALLCVVVLNWPGDVRGWPRLTLHVVFTILLGCIVINANHRLTRLLEWRPLAYVGLVSYGVYLLHKPGLTIAHRVLAYFSIGSPEILFLCGSVVSVCLAAISYRYFERPLLALKESFRVGKTKEASPVRGGLRNESWPRQTAQPDK